MTRVARKKKTPAKNKTAAKRVPEKKKVPAKRKPSSTRKPIRAGKFIESFIICEAIRNEERNKLTFLGVFSDSISLKSWPEDENTGVALQLAFYVSFRFIQKSKIKVRLLSPSNLELFRFEQEVYKKAPASNLITLILNPPGAALIPELGVYRFTIDYCNKRDYREFRILVDPAI